MIMNQPISLQYILLRNDSQSDVDWGGFTSKYQLAVPINKHVNMLDK